MKCCLCGQYMSGEDILLGYERSDGQFAHSECAMKLAVKGTHEVVNGDVLAKGGGEWEDESEE